MLTTAEVTTLCGKLLYFSHVKNLLQINIDFNEIFYVFSKTEYLALNDKTFHLSNTPFLVSTGLFIL